jgi:hypothetical protein
MAAHDARQTGPARIPGVHVGHIGGQDATVAQIRAYWQARGAVFLHHPLDSAGRQCRLDEVLDRSHIVFHAPAGTRLALSRDLARYCEHTGKPLILLEDDSIWALAKALATSLPLT